MTVGAPAEAGCAYWDVTGMNGEVARIQLDPWSWIRGVPTGFSCDGVHYSFGRFLRHGLARTSFVVAGQPAVLTMRLVNLKLGLRFRRAFKAAFHPGTLLAGVGGAAGVSGGMAGATAARTMLSWFVYELTVDGRSGGSWIVKVEGGAGDWRWMPPGGWMPDGESVSWPD